MSSQTEEEKFGKNYVWHELWLIWILNNLQRRKMHEAIENFCKKEVSPKVHSIKLNVKWTLLTHSITKFSRIMLKSQYMISFILSEN